MLQCHPVSIAGGVFMHLYIHACVCVRVCVCVCVYMCVVHLSSQHLLRYSMECTYIEARCSYVGAITV